MSHIFDAIQKSEVSDARIHLTDLAGARDLVECAEAEIGPLADGGEHRVGPVDIDRFGQFPSLRTSVVPQSKLVCITDDESLAAEKFRFLSIRLRHLQQRRPLKRLLVTSSMAEEGKSMVAANLACTLARKQQQRVLLLDGDLRRPTQTTQLGLEKLSGLSELLQGESGKAMNIYQLEGLGFCILPAGSPAQAPAELLQSRKLSVLFDVIGTWFDWIVIDSPPVLPLGDTTVWMRLADGIILVTRPGRTAKRHLQLGLEAIDKSKLLGALVNGSRDTAVDDYYYYRAGRTTASPAASDSGE